MTGRLGVWVEELFEFTRHVIYIDSKSSTMAEACVARWNKMKKASFIRLSPDADSLRQHCLGANYSSYLVPHTSLKHHPSPIGQGWELVGGRYRYVRHTRPVLPIHLPASEPTERVQRMSEIGKLMRRRKRTYFKEQIHLILIRIIIALNVIVINRLRC